MGLEPIPKSPDPLLRYAVSLCSHKKGDLIMSMSDQILCTLVQGLVIPVHYAVYGCIPLKIAVDQHHGFLNILQR